VNPTSPPTRVAPGEQVRPVRLQGIDGAVFDLAVLSGQRYMLSFLRFASCPFCNLRVHELTQRFEELGETFTIVVVFDSPLDNLIRHAARHAARFPILADETGAYYRAYAIERSFGGVLKGMVLRAPSLMKAMALGYLPTSPKGSLTTMPADFLVDELGVVRAAHYGTDEGDHLPFETVRAFAHQGIGALPAETRSR